MTDPRPLEIALAGEADLPAVGSFYAGVGYGGRPAIGERILVARRAGTIVGAVRLSPEKGTLVLRGMYVAEDLRGAGIGSRLLERIPAEIGARTCWCIPYNRLVDFYSRIGFRIDEGDGVPGHLAARKERYMAAGHDVTIMRRPADRRT